MGGGGVIYVKVWVGGTGGAFIFFVFCSVFVLLLIVLSCWYMIVSCVCFTVPFLLSLSLVPLIRCYKCVETVVFVL